MKLNMRNHLNEFKKFALKGSITDMAVGVIIGGAFGKIVTSLVNDIVMPLLSVATGKIKFENLFIALDGVKYANIEEARAANAVTLNYGSFITAIIDFLVISISIFLFIRQINIIREKFRKTEIINENKNENKPELKDCPFCKSKINYEAVKCAFCTADMPQNIFNLPDENNLEIND